MLFIEKQDTAGANDLDHLIHADRNDTANYIGQLARDLGKMAKRANLATIEYLLDLVVMETKSVRGNGLQEVSPDETRA